MNEHQELAGYKANALLQLMTKLAVSDNGIARLLKSMGSDLEQLIAGQVALPTRLMRGWSLYFSPEGPHGIYDKYPDLVDLHAELEWILRHPTTESYEKSRKLLGG